MKKKNKCIIVYISFHHMNTKKLLDGLKEKVDEIELVDIKDASKIDFSKYKYIGFASGIYYGMFHKSIISLAEKIDFNEEQRVFLIYTCGVDYKNHARGMENILKKKKCEYVGKFKCNGYDTYGILKYIGGISKGYPSKYDIFDLIDFIRDVLKK